MKIIFTACLMLTLAISQAQLKKGTWNIGTSTNAPMNLQWSSKPSGNNTFDFVFNPTLGYFTSNRFEIGGGPLFRYNGIRYKTFGGTVLSKTNNTSYGLNLYARYYLKNDKKLLPYLTSNVQYKHVRSVSSNTGGITALDNYHEWQAGLGAGFNWFISPRASLFSELSYTGNLDVLNDYYSGINLNVGFQIFLNRKKSK